MKVAGLILAAGESRRMGRPKALVSLDGRSFLSHGLAALHAGGCAPLLVVDGAHRLDGEALAGAKLVHNPSWPLGPLSSLQVGLRRALVCEPGLDGLLVHHVERPRVQATTIRALIESLGRQRDSIWQPTRGGRSGHPLLWPRAAFTALLALDPAQHSARTLIHGDWADRRRKLELDDPGVLDNFDGPDDLP